MITLIPITINDVEKLEGSSYGLMPIDKKLQMISASEREIHDGRFFKFFIINDGDETVGYLNICGQTDTVASISPEIKKEFRRNGFAFKGIKQAINYLKVKGYQMLFHEVKEENLPSVELHRKLGFSYVKDYVNRRGNKVRIYVKVI